MRSTIALWTASTAQLIVVVDVSIINVAVPSIRTALGADDLESTWFVLAYGVAFAGALLAASRLADVHGAARVLMSSSLAFTLASAVGGLATSPITLIGARLAQGLAAAAITPATLTLLTTTYPEGPARNRAIAVWTSVSVAGGGIGSLVGGVLTEFVSWRAVLLINVPIGIIVVALASRIRHRAADVPAPRFDIVGTVLSLVAIGGLTASLSMLVDSKATPVVIVAAGSGALASALWLRRNRRAEHQMIPTSLWTRRGVRRGVASTFLTAMCMQSGIWYFITFLVQDRPEYGPVAAGVAFLPLTAAVLVVNLVVAPRLLDRLAPGAPVLFGGVIAACGLLALAAGADRIGAAAFIGATVAIGVGGGLVGTPLAVIVTTGAGERDAGAASGLLNLAKQFGGAVGLATGGVAAAAAGSGRAAFATMAAAMLLAGAVTRPTRNRSARRSEI